MTQNSELTLTRRIVDETAANLFLTGKAGTGKTTFLRELQRRSTKRMIVLAPTGVAAINAGGVTIHSFFQFDFSPYLPGKGFLSGEKGRRFNFSKVKRKIISALELIVIDEISMVRPDILDAIDDTLRRLRNPTQPFGGVQLLLIGDLRQLSPVVTEAENEVLKEYYDSPYFFSSTALKQAGFLTVELTEVFRQEDADFIGLLNAVRDGRAGRQVLDRLNTRFIPDFNPPQNQGYVRLTSHNRMAAAVNDRWLQGLPGKDVTFTATIDGNFPENSYPADRELILKVGAQVMFIKNDTGEDRQYYNGLIGQVTAISEETVTVVPSNGGRPIEIGAATWENIKYEADATTGEISPGVDGTFSQIPLRLAWAITIHKSQGLTFERAIIDAAQSFAPGQTYVALSRCKTLEGMVLGQELPPSAIITDPTVSGFINDESRRCPSDEYVTTLSREYCRRQLAELFDFSSIQRRFAEFSRVVQEYVGPVHPELFKLYDSAEKEFEERVAAVGRRFMQIYASQPISASEIEENKTLIAKISSGSTYFIAELEKIKALFKKTPKDISNRSYIERLNNVFDSLDFELKVKLKTLADMASGKFTIASYSKSKAIALLNAGVGQPKNSFRANPSAQNNGNPSRKKKPKGYSKFESIRMFLAGTSISEIAAKRSLVATTIAWHIREGIAEGIITIEQVFKPETLSWLKSNYPSDKPRPTPEEFFAATDSKMDRNLATIYYYMLPPRALQPYDGDKKQSE